MVKYFDIYWWQWLFTSKNWTNFWCRFRGHPGVWWYNPGGLEPDMHCQRCGEDLG